MLINTEPDRPSPFDSMAEEGLAGIDELPNPRSTDESELDAGESLSPEEVDEVSSKFWIFCQRGDRSERINIITPLFLL